jgi:cyclase
MDDAHGAISAPPYRNQNTVSQEIRREVRAASCGHPFESAGGADSYSRAARHPVSSVLSGLDLVKFLGQYTIIVSQCGTGWDLSSAGAQIEGVPRMRFRKPLNGVLTNWARVVRPAAAALCLVLCGAMASAAAESEGGLEAIQVRPNFYMIAGAGGNIGVQIGSDGVVLVDSGNAASSDQVIALLKKLTPLPVRYIINTVPEPDHVGGNGKVAKAGLTIFTNALGNANFGNAMTNGGAASIMAHDSVLKKMSAPTGKSSAFPVDTWPTEAFYTEKKTFRMNDEGIEVTHQRAAHSDSDSFVFFRASDVVAAGDVLDLTRFPVIDVANGGSIQGEIDALNRLIELAIPPGPFIYKGTGTYIIPGHGRLAVQLDVVNYRDMVVVVRDVIADMIKKGMTLSQIKEASPAKPYEMEFGTQPGVTSAFIESIYKSLTASK